jgi:hypothetical protein
LHRRIAESPVSAPSQSHSLSGCDGSQIVCGDAAGNTGVALVGLYIPVLVDADGVYLPGDVIDDRWADDRPARTFHPHRAAGQVVGAWPAQTFGGGR